MPGPFITSLALALLGAVSPLEEKPRPVSENDWQIQVEFMAIVVPEKLALEVLDETPDEAGAKAGYRKVMAAVEQGSATVAGTQILRTEHGEAKSTRSGEELRYALSYDLPTFPSFDSAKDMQALPKDLKVFELPPDTIETMNLGVSLDASPEVSADGQWLRLACSLSHHRLAGWDEIVGGVTPGGAKIAGKQPRISTLRTDGHYYLRAGARTLAGAHKLPDPKKPEMELFFLRATTVRKPATPIPHVPPPASPAALAPPPSTRPAP